jgi:Family of unknown function (DUF5681)
MADAMNARRPASALSVLAAGMRQFSPAIERVSVQSLKPYPRNARLVSTKIGGQPGIGFEDRIKSLAIEEAYRPITIREGDRIERVPVVQAILRKVAVAAANGNTRAQQNYLIPAALSFDSAGLGKLAPG